jgi:L-ribulose-5-phosphate 3-epimerase
VFRLAYNTNGLAHHRLLDALRLLADLGYEGVAITPDVGQLDPLDLDPRLVDDVRRWSEELGLDLALETGARFLLDPRRKHFPSLLERDAADRARRVDFLFRTVDLAAELGADPVSLWAGSAPDGATAESGTAAEPTWTHLVDGLRAVLDHAGQRGVNIAFEPEPGMFVERPSGYLELVERLGSDGERLGLCLDVGHLLVTGDTPVPAQIRALAPRLVHVHLDDIAGGVHEHCMFGTGELDLPGTLAALIEVGYGGLAAVELSRDSHRGAWAAEEALRRLRDACAGIPTRGA